METGFGKIALMVLAALSLAGGKDCCGRAVSVKFGGDDFAAEIAERFVGALARRGYSFIDEQDIESLRKEITAFAAEYHTRSFSRAERDKLLVAVEQYVTDNFLHRPDMEWYDQEGAYLKFADVVNTFKWQLWKALGRKKLTAEQMSRRDSQREWVRSFVAEVPIRPGDGRPVGVAAVGVREWGNEYIEKKFADPLGLLYEPMTDAQFEVFRKLMERSSANGFYNTVSDIRVRALGAVAHRHTDVEKAYAYPFDIELPFDDEVRSMWGGGGGAGAHLVFASNAKFGGTELLLEHNRPVFDIVHGVLSTSPNNRNGDRPEIINKLVAKQGKGDIAYDDAAVTVLAVRSAKMAKLDVADWLEADGVSNERLREHIADSSFSSISVANLPRMNGPRPMGRSRGRIFIAVQTHEGRLAVIALMEREFGLSIYSRLR
ncbi:MAG: hypothetical protein ACYSUC_11795 [Planctomycetota bacterium]|jgi:hypothetical protein